VINGPEEELYERLAARRRAALGPGEFWYQDRCAHYLVGPAFTMFRCGKLKTSGQLVDQGYPECPECFKGFEPGTFYPGEGS
jgi:hypothetical protein